MPRVGDDGIVASHGDDVKTRKKLHGLPSSMAVMKGSTGKIM